MKRFSTSLAAVILFITPLYAQEAPSAQPQQQCFEREKLADQIARSGGSPVVVGMTSNPEIMMEIWENKEGNWTAFMTTKKGMMCPIASGVKGVHTAPQMCLDPIKCPRV